jgi:hypothetical protein
MDTNMETVNLLGNATAWAALLISTAGLAIVAGLYVALRRQVMALRANLAELSARSVQSEDQGRVLAGQIEQINLEIGRVDGAGLRLGLREAIALSRRGADPRELMNTCGIGDSEAQLIALMHGRRMVTESDTTNTSLVEDLT